METIAAEDAEAFGDFTDEFFMRLQEQGNPEKPPREWLETYFLLGYSGRFAADLFLEE